MTIQNTFDRNPLLYQMRVKDRIYQTMRRKSLPALKICKNIIQERICTLAYTLQRESPIRLQLAQLFQGDRPTLIAQRIHRDFPYETHLPSTNDINSKCLCQKQALSKNQESLKAVHWTLCEHLDQCVRSDVYQDATLLSL